MPWLDGTNNTIEVWVGFVADWRLLDGEALKDASNISYMNITKSRISYKNFMFPNS